MADPMTDERLAEIRERAERCVMWPSPAHHEWVVQVGTRDMPALLAEVERLRGDVRELGVLRRDMAAVQAERDAALDGEPEPVRLRAEVHRLRADRDAARTDAKQWHDTYQDSMNGVDKFLVELLDMLPGAADEGADAYDQIPRAIKKLKAKRAEAVAEVARLVPERDRARDIASAAEAERDRLAEQVKRVRDMHTAVCSRACGLDDACECGDRDLVCGECWEQYPCRTIGALVEEPPAPEHVPSLTASDDCRTDCPACAEDR